GPAAACAADALSAEPSILELSPDKRRNTRCDAGQSGEAALPRQDLASIRRRKAAPRLTLLCRLHLDRQDLGLLRAMREKQRAQEGAGAEYGEHEERGGEA